MDNKESHFKFHKNNNYYEKYKVYLNLFIFNEINEILVKLKIIKQVNVNLNANKELFL